MEITEVELSMVYCTHTAQFTREINVAVTRPSLCFIYVRTCFKQNLCEKKSDLPVLARLMCPLCVGERDKKLAHLCLCV